MRIGIIKETKSPVDNRVPLDPAQVAALKTKYPKHDIVVQSSDIRAYSDDEYRSHGVEVVADLSDCDLLLGIKEARSETIIPGKHYIFFGHVAKMQEYNRPLLQSMIERGITFSDYEYMVDDNGLRVCAFGWWAGCVGVYYTLRAYGLRTDEFTLPPPHLNFTLNELIATLKAGKLPAVKVLVTGNGRVSHGVQHVLNAIGAQAMTSDEFLATDKVETLSYSVADVDRLVKSHDGSAFSFHAFLSHPDNYHSDFDKWSQAADVLMCGHFWNPNAPVYLGPEELRHTRIKGLVDSTCDIMGSVKSTRRSSTHDNPFYDYNPDTEQEEPAFSSAKNITVMAVDTCPNALPRDTSTHFGQALIEHIFEPLLQGNEPDALERATILRKGVLTPHFNYLTAFAKGD